MAVERVGLAAPWRWLQQSAGLLRAHPRALFGGASLLVATALLPSVATQLLATVLPVGAAQAIGLLLSLLIYPPAVGGYFRLLHARASGLDWPAGSLLAIFGDGPALRRLVIANIIVVCVAMLAVLGLASLLGGDALLGFFAELSKLQPGAKQLPPLPPGAFGFALSLMLVGVLLLAIQGLSYAELALGTRPPLPALAAGLGAAWRNFGVLLLFFLPASMFAFLGFMMIALAAVLVSLALAVISPALGSFVVLGFSLLSVVLMYALLFGLFYYAWREIFGEVPPAEDAPHRIAA